MHNKLNTPRLLMSRLEVYVQHVHFKEAHILFQRSMLSSTSAVTKTTTLVQFFDVKVLYSIVVTCKIHFTIEYIRSTLGNYVCRKCKSIYILNSRKRRKNTPLRLTVLIQNVKRVLVTPKLCNYTSSAKMKCTTKINFTLFYLSSSLDFFRCIRNNMRTN